jgi:O-antigen ligase
MIRRAEPCIVVFSILIVFSPMIEGGTTHLAVMGIRLLLILLGCLFLMKSLLMKMLTWPVLPVDAFVASALGLAAASVMLSPYKQASVQWFALLLGYAGLLYLFVRSVDRWEHIITIVVVMSMTGLFEAGLAVYQRSSNGSGRVTGTFFNPNFLAGYLAAISCVLFGLFCYGKMWSRLRTGVQAMVRSTHAVTLGLVGAVGLMVSAIVLTGSRAGVVAFVIGITTVAGIRFGWRGMSSATGLLLCLFILIPNPVHDRVRAEHLVNPEAYARWNIWQSSMSAIVDHPLGAGLGLYQYVYPRYAVPLEGALTRYGRVAQTAHNEYLQVGVELGIAGLMVLLGGIGMLACEARRVLHGHLSRRHRGVMVGVVGAIASILVHAALDSNLHEPAIAIIFVLCAGMLFAVKRMQRPDACRVRCLHLQSRASRWMWAGAGTLSAALLCWSTLQPAMAWTAYENGSRAARVRDHGAAIASYEAAITLEPGKSLYHSSLAASYFTMFRQTGDVALVEATLSELHNARQLNPLDGRLWGLAGHVYQTLSEHHSGLSRHDAAGTRQPVEWRTLARGAFEEAIVLEPFNALHYLELGRLHLKDGRRDDALIKFRQVTALEPNFLPARASLIEMYMEAGRIDEARAEYREILDRRVRFAGMSTNAFEAQFLSVDVKALEAAVTGWNAKT